MCVCVLVRTFNDHRAGGVSETQRKQLTDGVVVGVCMYGLRALRVVCFVLHSHERGGKIDDSSGLVSLYE